MKKTKPAQKTLTPKRQAFIAAKIAKPGISDREAARQAGFGKAAAAKAGRVAKDPDVKAAIDASTQRVLEKAELTAVRVLEELRRLSFADIRQLFDASGNLRPITELTQEQAACIQGFEVIKKNAEAGDGHIDVVHKVRILDKTKPLEMLAKYFGLLVEKIDHTGEIHFRWQQTPEA